VLPAASLFLRDVTADVTCSSVACANIVTLRSCLVCRKVVTVLSSVMSQYYLNLFRSVSEMALRTIQSKPKSLDKVSCKFTVCLLEIGQVLHAMLQLNGQTEIHDETT
jgi:hypothetical protein